MRFSLRTLFVLMTVCCGVAWYFYRCERASRAVDTIRACGGMTEYKWNEHLSAPWDSRDELLARWIRYLFDTPEVVWLPHPREKFCRGENVRVDCGDDAIAAAAVFPNLLELKIEGRGVTNAGVRRLRTARRLRKVELEGQIGDEGLAVLAALPLLEKLSLKEATISVHGMRRLSKVPLQELSLSQCDIDDAAMPFVPTRQLWSLDLSQTKISDAGLKLLPDAPNLKQLDLSQTRITDAGLVALRPQLTSLLLSQTAISDEGAGTLAELPNLWRLNLARTRLTTVGVERLTVLPKIAFLHLDETPLGNNVLPVLKKFQSPFLCNISLKSVGLDAVGLLDSSCLERSALPLQGKRFSAAGFTDAKIHISSSEVSQTAADALTSLASGRMDRLSAISSPQPSYPGPGLRCRVEGVAPHFQVICVD